MNTAADTSKPRLIEGVNILKLAIGPEEAFVLSRIDGNSSLQDIINATGLSPDRVQRALLRLVELGAIRYASSVAPMSAQISRPIPQSRELSRQFENGSQAASGVHSALTYDAAELEGDFDIDRAKRQFILDRFYLLDTSNHYEVLGVPSDADRKAIKSAYYELVASIHPDKYFGKNLGHFRQKLEQCFARLTEAYEALSRVDSREQYDAYLKSQRQVADLQRALDMRVTPDELDRLEAELIRIAEATAASSPPSSTSMTGPAVSTSASMQFRVLTEQERRQALASALRRSTPGIRFGAPTSTAAASRASSPDLNPAADGLKHHYEARLRHARELKLKAHLQSAKDALSNSDPVNACNALRFAQQLAPDDKAIAAHLEEVQKQASSVLSARYLEQAKYEEEHSRFESASRTFALAARSKPSAELWERAARCGLKCKTDLRTAAEMAKKALEMAGESGGLRALLAEIFLEAQLTASAAAEIERAARLLPNDDSIRELRRRLERNGT